MEASKMRMIGVCQAAKARGNMFVKDGRYLEAIEEYLKITSSLNSGIVLLGEDFHRRKHAMLLAVHLNMALCHLRLEQYEDTRCNCDIALELDPHNIKAFYRRAQANDAEGYHRIAIKDYESILRIEPTNKAAKTQLAKSQGNLDHNTQKNSYSSITSENTGKVSSDIQSDSTKEWHDKSIDNLVHDVRDLSTSELSGKYILVVESERICVSKKDMWVCSEYIKSYVNYSNKAADSDKKGENGDDEVIKLDALDPSGVQAVVEFATKGKVDLDGDNIFSVAQAASFLQVHALLNLCEASVLSVENCVDLLNFAEQYNLSKLCRRITVFLPPNFAKLEKKQYCALSKNDLILLLGDDKLNVGSEAVLVDIVINWLTQNRGIDFDCTTPNVNSHEEPWITFAEMVYHIRWGLIRPNDIEEVCGKMKSLMEAIPECAKLLRDAEDYHGNIYAQPVKQTIHTRVRSNGPSLFMRGLDESQYSVYNLTTKLTQPLKHKLHEIGVMTLKGPTFVNVGNFVFMCGGEEWKSNHGNYGNSCYAFRYDPRFNHWIDLAPMGASRAECPLVSNGKNIFAIGSDFDWYEKNQMCESYDIETNTWAYMPHFPIPVEDYAVCVVDNSIYISGGNNNGITSNEMLRYDIDKSEWNRCANMVPRANHAMEYIGNNIYVIGGNSNALSAYSYISPFDRTSPHPLSNIQRYSISTDQWTDMTLKTTPVFTWGSFVEGNKINIQYYDAIQIFTEVNGDIVKHEFSSCTFGMFCAVMHVPFNHEVTCEDKK